MEMPVSDLLQYAPDFWDFEDWLRTLKNEEYFVKLENTSEGYLELTNEDNTIELGKKEDAQRFSLETAEIYAGEYGDVELVSKLDYFNIYRKRFPERFQGLIIV